MRLEEERSETFLHQSSSLEGTGLPAELLARMLGALRRQAEAEAVTVWVRAPGTDRLKLHAADPPDLPLGESLPEGSGPVRETFEQGVIRVVPSPSIEGGFDHPPLILDRLQPESVVLLPIPATDRSPGGVAALYLKHTPPEGDPCLFEWARWAALLDAFLEPREPGPTGQVPAPALLLPSADGPRTDEDLRQVAAGLARRMKTYLATVTPALGQAQGMLEEQDAALRFLRYVSEGLDRMDGILDRLLTFGGQGPLVAEMIRMPECVSEAVRRLEPERSRTVRLSAELPRGLPSLMADRARVVAALMEIIRNALEATAEGTEVRVVVGEEEDGIAVSVQDEGPGMSAEVLGQAGLPFFSTRRPDRHPGLGISSVKGIVEQHGGRLSISSRTGAGTTVRLWFPLEPLITPGEP